MEWDSIWDYDHISYIKYIFLPWWTRVPKYKNQKFLDINHSTLDMQITSSLENIIKKKYKLKLTF
jgi:hypothetical protein